MSKNIGWKLVYVPTYEEDKLSSLTPAIMKISYDESDVKDEVSEVLQSNYHKNYLLISKIFVEEIYDMDVNVINPEKCLPIKKIYDVEYRKHEETCDDNRGLYVFRTYDEVFAFKKEFNDIFEFCEEKFDAFIGMIDHMYKYDSDF